MPSIARTLGLRERAGQPDIELLRQALRERRCLLVLDNFEHLLPAAVDVAGLLQTCPLLTVLVTSREPLHLRWEVEFPVAPLALPDPTRATDVHDVAESAAVALFVLRAQVAYPEFALTDRNVAAVARICRLLDGLPLAIELAAAWTRVLDPATLLSRLEGRLNLLSTPAQDAPDRHRSLWAAIGWSYDVLDAAQRNAFHALAVFAGGCTLEAAEAVSAGTAKLEVLADLVAKNLLQQGRPERSDETRLRMLETVRAFGLERLHTSADGEAAAIRQRYAEYYLALAERAQPELFRREGKRWLDRLELEADNFRAASRWARE
jgi:predicted ATPase